MKHLLVTTIAALVLVGCVPKQLQKTKAIPLQHAEPPAAKAPEISIYDAVQRGNIEAVKQHIAIGTDINAKSNTRSQYTPLLVAVMKGQKEITELLIANGADVNAKEEQRGMHTLHIATMLGRTEVVKLLISKGADVNAKDRLGRTPLDTAIRNNRSELADLLRKHGAKTGEELKAEE